MKTTYYELYVFLFVAVFTIKTITMCGCSNEQPTQINTKKTETDQHYQFERLKVIDGQGQIHYVDSTWDYKIENTNSWVKLLWKDGETYLEYPYEINNKPFTTRR